MALLHFNGVGIAGMAAAVPARTVFNRSYMTDVYGVENVQALVDKIGIEERRFATEDVCASDLCCAAAERLLADTGTSKEDVRLLVFVSVSADYKFPPTATILQHRLGLPASTVAYDVTMGCSAVLYGLSIVYSMLPAMGGGKALLLIGDTNSRIYSPEDRTSAYIFGDAGTAMLIETGERFGESHFSINTDGSKYDLIMAEAGGSRHPSSAETLVSRVVDEHGNRRSLEQAWMRGGDVLQLVIANVPRDVRGLLAATGTAKGDIDYVLLHQANSFMNTYLAAKLGFPAEKVPSSIRRFGNTGGASIPLTMVSEMRGILAEPERKKILMSAFGIGMTWGSALLSVGGCKVSPIVEI